MIVAVCIEERGGMRFNKRRVSRDSAVYADLLASCPQRLWMNSNSCDLFAQLPQEKIRVAEDFLQQAEAGDWCFVEDQPLQPWEPAVEKLVLYQWNRKYPADVYFDLDLTKWELEQAVELVGTSHKTITKEIYRRQK